MLMAITMVTGDLFDLGLPAIGHGCDCAGAMGRGYRGGVQTTLPRHVPGVPAPLPAGQLPPRGPRLADPRTTMRYDRARKNLDRHPNYILAAYRASGT